MIKYQIVLIVLTILVEIVSPLEPGERKASVQLTVQCCHEDEFGLLVNEKARAAFDSCDEPLVGFDVTLVGWSGKLAADITDDNGVAMLGPIEIEKDEWTRLAICKDDEPCFSVRFSEIAKSPIHEGKNFVLFQNGKPDTKLAARTE